MKEIHIIWFQGRLSLTPTKILDSIFNWAKKKIFVFEGGFYLINVQENMKVTENIQVTESKYFHFIK